MGNIVDTSIKLVDQEIFNAIKNNDFVTVEKHIDEHGSDDLHVVNLDQLSCWRKELHGKEACMVCSGEETYLPAAFLDISLEMFELLLKRKTVRDMYIIRLFNYLIQLKDIERLEIFRKYNTLIYSAKEDIADPPHAEESLYVMTVAYTKLIEHGQNDESVLKITKFLRDYTYIFEAGVNIIPKKDRMFSFDYFYLMSSIKMVSDLVKPDFRLITDATKDFFIENNFCFHCFKWRGRGLGSGTRCSCRIDVGIILMRLLNIGPSEIILKILDYADPLSKLNRSVSVMAPMPESFQFNPDAEEN